MPGITALNDSLTGLLIALFSTKGVALALAGAILFSAILILFGVYFSRVAPIRKAVTRRIVDFPRTVAPSELEQVSAIMGRPDKQSFNLERAWAAFRSSLTFTPQGELRSGAPAWTVFNIVTSETGVLGWWSNLFVAIGLIFTFLGVVAALSEATSVLGTGNASTATMQAALVGPAHHHRHQVLDLHRRHPRVGDPAHLSSGAGPRVSTKRWRTCARSSTRASRRSRPACWPANS